MRYTGPKNRLARREGVDLGLKSKPVDVSTTPGQHGGARRFGKASEFGLQLREKQKAKRIYGLTEKQFRNLFKKAAAGRHATGITFLASLERRLDNVIYRSGFACTRAQARQMVNHGIFLVNGKKIDVPSYQVKAGDVITVRERSIDHAVLREMEGKKIISAEWITADLKKRTITITRLPEEGDTEALINVSSIIEFYSR